ncbi:hypothetical protein [Mesorhizobium hawassense]|uniref:hypothetical protein n=1 Tax=Mesorhizobium hawassense TaxID=1209954 RepID=UPI00142D4CC5|nr:hypothetical protein [Mesorhizobium hawassense]
MDRNQNPGHAAESSSRVGRAAEQLYRSDGPLSDVADGLVSSSPRETARNLGAFKSSGRAARQVLEGTELGRFDERINRLGRAAGNLYDDGVGGTVHGNDPDRGFARYQTAAVKDIIDFQSAQKQSALVDKILSIAESRTQLLAISKIAPAWGKLDNESRERLVNRAIEVVENPPDLIAQNNAASALIKGYGHLNANQQQRVPIGELRQIAPDARQQHQAGERSSDVDRSIHAIEAAANIVREHGALGSSTQFVEIAQISASVSNAHQQAREELIESQRSRGRSGR